MRGTSAISRRTGLRGGVACAGIAVVSSFRALADAIPLRFGLTPVFLTSDLDLLAELRRYLAHAMGRPVQLVSRRTYQEITALLVSRQLDAAWICGYPFVAYRTDLELVAVPVWNGRALYQSYLIAGENATAASLKDLGGTVHAYSDPDSNSGYLVTRAALVELGMQPQSFFRQTFFTYGHRNVIRAVAAGLADSGSVDGYVYEVLRESEPDLVKATRVIARSEWLGFPPIACPAAESGSASTARLRDAFVRMSQDEGGRKVLAMLKLDGFRNEPAALFDGIAGKLRIARRVLE
jgi:phosphonate transport system substrate-binding protein